MKCNRLAVLSLEDKHQGYPVRIDALNLERNTTQQIYLKGFFNLFNQLVFLELRKLSA